MERGKLHALGEKFRARCGEEVDRVVHLDALVKNSSHEGLTVGSPLDTNRAVGLGFSKLGEILELPEIHLASQVAEATDEADLREGTTSDGVSVPLAKLEEGVAILVVQSSGGRLDARYHDESLSRRYPSDILYLIVENGHVLTVSAAKDLNVLEGVFTVIRLT